MCAASNFIPPRTRRRTPQPQLSPEAAALPDVEVGTIEPAAVEESLIEEIATRLASDDAISWVAAELVQEELKVGRMLLAANLSRLNALIEPQRGISETTPLVEILAAIQVRLCGLSRHEAISWLESRRTSDGYRRDAVWELLTWIRATAQQSRESDRILTALERAFLHDELCRNVLQPAKAALEILEDTLRHEGRFFELAVKRREQCLAKYNNRPQDRSSNRRSQTGDRRTNNHARQSASR